MTLFRLYFKRLGDHVHCRLFAGQSKGALGKCGEFCFRHSEFTDFTRIHRVLGIEFIREMNSDGTPAGEDIVYFDQFEQPMVRWQT